MITESVARTINRELNTLRDEVMAYANDAELWVTPGGVTNSAGNLALHICGNLQYLIGAVLGNTGYVRDRDAEFSRSDVSQDEIVAEINTTADAVATTLAALDSEALAEAYPLDVLGVRPATGQFLIHLATHLAFHIGQIDYHRRIVTGGPSLGEVQSIAKLLDENG